MPGLIGGGADNKRGHYIGKEFGKALRRHGIADKAVVYHGLRASFAQKLERGGVAMTTAALLLGHERDGMSYGTYSKGVDDDALVDAVKKVNYGARGRCAGEGVW